MVTPSSDAYVLADAYLKAINAPVTPSNRNAMAAWLYKENRLPGTNLVAIPGFNPLGITPGVVSSSCGSHNSMPPLTTFCSYNESLSAFNSALSLPQFAGIKKGFQTGNGSVAIESIINSPWASGKPPSYGGFGSGNSLLSIYQELSANPQSGTSSHSLYDYLLNAGVDVQPTDTYAQVKSKFLTAVMNDKQFQPWQRAIAVLNAQLLPFSNTPVAQIPWAKGPFTGTWNPLNTGGVNTATDKGAAASIPGADLLPGITWIATHIIPIGAAAVGVIAILIGLTFLYKDTSGSGSPAIAPNLVPVIIRGNQ